MANIAGTDAEGKFFRFTPSRNSCHNKRHVNLAQPINNPVSSCPRLIDADTIDIPNLSGCITHAWIV